MTTTFHLSIRESLEKRDVLDTYRKWNLVLAEYGHLGAESKEIRQAKGSNYNFCQIFHAARLHSKLRHLAAASEEMSNTVFVCSASYSRAVELQQDGNASHTPFEILRTRGRIITDSLDFRDGFNQLILCMNNGI